MVPMLIGGSLNSLGYGLATLGPALGVAWIALFGFVLAFIVK